MLEGLTNKRVEAGVLIKFFPLHLAHADYLIHRGGHPAAAFAMAYNPRLLMAHLQLPDLPGTTTAAATTFGRLPQWAGGTALENAASAQKQARAMMAALEATRSKNGDDSSTSGFASEDAESASNSSAEDDEIVGGGGGNSGSTAIL